MKVRSVAAAVAVAVLGLCLSVAAPPAAAGGCVTPSEFARARTGMTSAQVARVFGTYGRVATKSSGYGTTIIIRDYKACTQFGAVSVLFTNGRLTTKSSVF
jgi:hypothetical protein